MSEPREMWGSDEERFLLLEQQLAELAAQTTILARAINTLINAEETAQADPETHRPQEATARFIAFEELVEAHARRFDYWEERRGVPVLVKLADSLGVGLHEVTGIWSSEPPERVPGEWFDMLEGSFD